MSPFSPFRGDPSKKENGRGKVERPKKARQKAGKEGEARAYLIIG